MLYMFIAKGFDNVYIYFPKINLLHDEYYLNVFYYINYNQGLIFFSFNNNIWARNIIQFVIRALNLQIHRIW